MKKTNFSLALFFLASILHAQSWVKVADFPADGRDDGTSFTINGIAYCGSGVKPFFPLGDFYAFDLAAESWSQIASLPQGEERQYACGFASDSLGYIFGGYSNTFLKDLWQYNPLTNTWLEKTALPADPRSGAASFVIDSIAYVIGGKNSNSEALTEVWAYNMNTDSWQQKNDLSFGGRWRSGDAAINGKGYLAFGLDDSIVYHDEVYEYDPILDSWTLITNFPEGGRNYIKLHAMGDKLIAIGGNDSAGNFLNESWAYDLTSDSWEVLVQIPGEGRRGGMSFQSPMAIYYTTGLADSSERLVETIKLVDPTYILERSHQANIQVYPNPAHSFFFIDIPLSWQEGKLEVYSEDGRLKYFHKLTGLDITINCQGWTKEVYFMKIVNENYIVFKTLIKL